MSAIDLPRPLESYFAHAEMEPRADSRRFTITLPFYQDSKLDRIQWWWHVKHAEEKLVGDAGVTARRTQEIARFVRHVERWLDNNRLRLGGTDPIPVVAAAPAPALVLDTPVASVEAPLPIASQNAA
jgi:hypothetical protein